MSETKGPGRRAAAGGNRRAGARRAAGVRRRADGQPGKGSSRTAPRHSSRTQSGAAASAGAAGAARSARRAKAAGASSRRPKNFLNYPRAGRGRFARWLPSWRLMATLAALVVIAGVGLSIWVYNAVDIPEKPNDIAVAQTSTVYYADGTTPIGEFSEVDRTIIPSDQIPDTVRNAAVASEDSTFYENRGISPRGILRALINNLAGGDRQGASTITQQYVERYLTGTETSYVGKVKEMVMAIKLDQEMSKEEILSGYLNTIYFGRGAYGIEAASQAYFGKPASELDDAEASLLVAVIPAPSSYDPAVNPERAQQLWNRVIERQVNETGTLTPAEADALQFPETVPPSTDNVLGGNKGYLMQFVRSELIDRGYTEQEIDTGGLKIVSTIEQSKQDIATEAVNQLPEGRPENNHVGAVTLDPDSGAIITMYGGPDYVKQARNDATQSRMQAGSIFKTFTLIAALENGYSLNSTWDGSSPKDFPGGWHVKNFGDESYGTVTLKRATARSINTAYAEVNREVGPDQTVEYATKLGLPEDTPGLEAVDSNVLGSASPTPLEMAEAYATIASGGIHRDAYMVQSVTSPDGSQDYEHQDEGERVLDEDVATNATVALQGPPQRGGTASRVRGEMDRPVAGKTGTADKFRAAWFVGFTPQYVTSVGMFQPTPDGSGEESLTPWAGEDAVTGSTFPVDVWLGIMRPLHEGLEVRDFAPETRLDNQKRNSDRTEEPAPTREQTRAPRPDPEPEPEPEPSSPEETPSESPSPSEEPSEPAAPSEEPSEPAAPSEEPSEPPSPSQPSSRPPSPSSPPEDSPSATQPSRPASTQPPPTERAESREGDSPRS